MTALRSPQLQGASDRRGDEDLLTENVDGLHEVRAARAVEIGIAVGAGDPDVIAGEVHGHVVLEGEVVDVNPPYGERGSVRPGDRSDV